MMNSRDMLARLIAYDTVSRNSNLALIEFVRDYLADHGVHSELIHDGEHRKANLHAMIGPQDRAGVVLSGHTDVVPIDGQPWSVPAFEMTERNGRLYGRGTADMKGYLACVLAAVPRMQQAALRRPIHLALSYDEEVGCLGVGSLIERLDALEHKPIACIVGEPTEMQPVLGHKGKLAMRGHVTGAACHSAHAPRGVNAISYAARVIRQLDMIADRLAAQPRDERFDPPFSTLQTGLIQGGSALNIVPADCTFDWEMRALPDVNPERVAAEIEDYIGYELLPKMRAIAPESGIRMERLSAYPGLTTDVDSEAARLLLSVAERNDVGTVAFGTEAGLFDRAGIPAMVCGPGCMAQGHKADEFIAIDQLHQCDALLDRLTRQLSG